VRPAHSALRGHRLYLLTLTGADACHRMMRRSGMHPIIAYRCRCMPQDDAQKRHAPNVGTCGRLACAPNVGCAGHVLMYTRMAPRPGGRRWRGPAVLAVRTELIADATDVSRDAPRYAANLQMSAEMLRDTTRISRMSAEMHRGSPRSTVTREVGGKLRCTSSLDVQGWPGSTVALCTNTKDVRGFTFQNTFIPSRLGVYSSL